VGSTEERHYVIYWPEDSTWDDSAASSVSRNRVTFMRRATSEAPILFLISHFRNRYLTKICDQVVALVSAKHSASMVWNDEDTDSSETESMDIDRDSDRLVTFVVEKTNDQEDGAELRPGFLVFLVFIESEFISNSSKMKSRHISSYEIPEDCSPDVDSSIFVPRLLHGETTQAFYTATYIPHHVLWEEFDHLSISGMFLEQML
jgi:hypothetical protein